MRRSHREIGKKRREDVVFYDLELIIGLLFKHHFLYHKRVPVIQVVPVTAWSEKKAAITTNVKMHPSKSNGLSKKSIADCLQTRPIDHRQRLVKIRGRLSSAKMEAIDQALKIVFDLDS